ncbi:hypothetical protein BDV12DRAFT_192093 [Aspergillus spectabilis]
MSRARASRNCANCRAVKRRCDKQFPHCGQCIRLKEDCPGYRDEWELVFRNQTDQTIKRSKEKMTPKTNKHSPPRPYLLSPHMDQIGVNYFLHHFVTSDQCSSRGYLNYVPTVFNADGEHPTLVASMAAVGLMALANSTQQPELVSHARVKYSEAIRSVNAALASPVESVKDSTLMSVISLGVFEHFSDFNSWVRHVQGAAALMVVRGKSQFCRTAAIPMFHQVRTDLAIACMHRSKQFPADMEKLQEDASMYTDTSSPHWLLGVLATRCVSLLWRVDNNKGVVPWPDLLDEATALQRDFQLVFGVLAIQEPYTTTRGAAGDADLVYNDRFDLYRTPWAIRIWNNARNLQMIVCEIVCYLLNKVLVVTPDLAPATCAQIKAKLQETLQILSQLSDDILATVPQVLGVVSPVPESCLAVNSPLGASVAGGYILTWGLYMVGKSPATAAQTRKWIIRRLGDIVKYSGIALARQLLDDIVKIDQSAV